MTAMIILGAVDRVSGGLYGAYVPSLDPGHLPGREGPNGQDVPDAPHRPVDPGRPPGPAVGGTKTAPASIWTARGALRVPQITVYFWVIKALSTAFGEASSDFLVRKLHPIPAVGLGFVMFCGALALQFSRHRYIAWSYWLAVAGVGVFGTMAADVLHVGFHVPYIASSLLYAVVLAAVFVLWQRTEKTLSIHTIDTVRREIFYWAAVVATFAMGTALGDLTATTLHLGFGASMLLFAGIILIPAVGCGWFDWDPIFTFWFAYVVTRPLGASFADWVGKPTNLSGLGWGSGRISLVLAGAIVCLVAFLSVAHRDVQRQHPPVAPAK
jgi:uncharacterized membrane-anchored protein